MNTSKISELLYNSTNEALLNYVNSTQDENELFVIAFNYNWEDGLAIPKAILSNPVCSLSTALTIFYLAEGEQIFYEEEFDKKSDWGKFVTTLKKDILCNKYPSGHIAFQVPLSKLQIYKLKKVLNKKELLFITDISGEDLRITL